MSWESQRQCQKLKKSSVLDKLKLQENILNQFKSTQNTINSPLSRTGHCGNLLLKLSFLGSTVLGRRLLISAFTTSRPLNFTFLAQPGKLQHQRPKLLFGGEFCCFNFTSLAEFCKRQCQSLKGTKRGLHYIEILAVYQTVL